MFCNPRIQDFRLITEETNQQHISYGNFDWTYQGSKVRREGDAFYCEAIQALIPVQKASRPET